MPQHSEYSHQPNRRRVVRLFPRVSSRRGLVILGMAATAALLAPPRAVAAEERELLEPVVLQLSEDHSFQFAGYYAAAWRGIFRDAGLEVEIRPGVDANGLPIDALTELIEGRADFAISGAEALEPISRGEEIALVATFLQRSDLEVFARPDTRLEKPADLSLLNLQAGIDPHHNVEILSLRDAGEPLAGPLSLNPLPEPRTIEHLLARLLTGQVDGALAPALPMAGLIADRGIELVSLSPSEQGGDFSGDSLFTHRRVITRSPKVVWQMFLAAQRGWHYALVHHEEMAAEIATKYPPGIPVSDPVRYNEAIAKKVRELTLFPIVAIGQTSARRWQRMADIMFENGVLKTRPDMRTVLFDYNAYVAERERRRNSMILITLAGMAIATGAYIMRVQNLRVQERQRNHAALRESEASLRMAVESGSIGLWEWNAAARTFVWNNQLKAIFGFAPQAWGLTPDQFMASVHPQDRPVTERLFRSAFEQKHEFRHEFRIVRSDGSVRWINAIGRVDESDKKHRKRMRGAALDITERRLAAEQLQTLNVSLEQHVKERTAELASINQELEAFSYSVSHDLRTPLRGIAGWAHILHEDYGGRLDDAGRLHLNRIMDETKRMARLIDDLINLARLSRATLRPRTLDLSAMVNEIHTRLTATYPGREVTLRCEEKLHATGDPTLLEVVLFNLLDNAWKFTSGTADAVLEIGRARAGEFFVRDNGAGFDMQIGAKLFQPFERFHSREEFPGTGIGLATVRRLIQRHGGKVRAESAAGVGTTIYFSLP